MKDLMKEEMSQEFKSRVLASAKMELAKNKPEPTKWWMWVSAPIAVACMALIFMKTNTNPVTSPKTESYTAEFAGVNDLSDIELINNLDIMEVL